MNVPFFYNTIIQKIPKRVGLSHPSIVPYGCFKTKDNVNILFSIYKMKENGSYFMKMYFNLSDKLKKKV